MLLTGIISLILLTGPTEVQSTPEGLHYRDASLIFRWDNSTYDDSYLGNSEAADKLINLLEEIGEENIDSVRVVSYASPEGVYEHNMKLSRQRAAEFNAVVRQRIGLKILNTPITVTSGGEAWEQLRVRVAEDTLMSHEAREATLRLLDDDTISNDTRKWRMAHNALGSTDKEGNVYNYLLKHHYRYLRCLAIRIYVKDGSISGTEDLDDGGRSLILNDSTEQKPARPEDEDGQETEIAGTEESFSGRSSGKRTGTPVIGLSSNLIYDATYIPHYGFTSVPSFSLEYYPADGHWTYGVDVDWSHWLHYPEHRFNQIHNITAHARRYFKTGEDGFRGLYINGSLNAFAYGLGWDAKGWEGQGLGLSAGIGHKWNWGRFFLDTGIDAGFLYSRYDPYVWGNDATGWYYYDYAGDPDEFVTLRKGWTWFGPTRVYISIGLDLFKRKK